MSQQVRRHSAPPECGLHLESKSWEQHESEKDPINIYATPILHTNGVRQTARGYLKRTGKASSWVGALKEKGRSTESQDATQAGPRTPQNGDKTGATQNTKRQTTATARKRNQQSQVDFWVVARPVRPMARVCFSRWSKVWLFAGVWASSGQPCVALCPPYSSTGVRWWSWHFLYLIPISGMEERKLSDTTVLSNATTT